MIILGDVASPNSSTSKVIANAISKADFNLNQTILFNLEGLITDSYPSNEEKPILFNHSSVLNCFKNFETKIAALANNHTLDLPEYLDSTKKILASNDFESIGAGNKEDDNFEFVVVQESGYNVYVMNACWDFLLYHQNIKNSSKTVNLINELYLISWVKSIKKNDHLAKIVLYFHWSFDLEILPFPAYRRFSKALIEAGVSLVIGGHSHCIQGGEMYQDGYIAYGLGNFFLPNNIYANGKLAFPKMSNKGWAIEWDIITNKVNNHYFEYSQENSNHNLTYINKEGFGNDKTLTEYSPFTKLSDTEYDSYFKINRRKKRLVPVFYKFEPSLKNRLKLKGLKTRAKLARFLAEKGIIGWQN